MNQGVNRILKARMLLNSQLFIGEDHYNDCEDLCLKIFSGDYGSYNIADDYRDIYNLNNTQCSEVVFAFAAEDGQGATNALTNMRNMPFLPYNYYEYADCEQFEGIGAWNCVIVVPSHDNSGTVLPTGGTDTGGKSFITDYNDKLGGVWDRMDDRDIRKQNYVYDSSTKNYKGIFLKGAMKASFGKEIHLKLTLTATDRISFTLISLVHFSILVVTLKQSCRHVGVKLIQAFGLCAIPCLQRLKMVGSKI